MANAASGRTFGFHQSRWGYENVSVNREVVKGYRDAGIPLECMWNGMESDPGGVTGITANKMISRSGYLQSVDSINLNSTVSIFRTLR